MDKLSRFFNRIHRLSLMKEMGIWGIISVSLLLVFTACLFFFAKDQRLLKLGDEQPLTINPIHVRKNDAYFQQFLANIKSNKGTLVMGTSESGPLGGFNYWELLNADPEIEQQFSVFYGAGRFCEMYFPLITERPEDWENMNLLIFVNPTYWRFKLNEPSRPYQLRYLDKYIIEKTKPELISEGIYAPFFSQTHYSHKMKNVGFLTNYLDKHFHTLYYTTLNSYLDTEEDSSVVFTSMSQASMNPNLLSKDILDSLRLLVDSTYNSTQDFLDHGISEYSMPKLDTASNYRYDALEGMFTLCKKHNISATYIIGPYNGVLAKAVSSKQTMDNYSTLIKDIQHFFEKHNQRVIDLSDLSHTSHTFLDAQHHSAYGGMLIYKRLKEYYEK